MKKCCFGCLIAILVIVVACVVCDFVVLNTTPLKLGISETDLVGDVSISDLGLENEKLKDLLTALASLNSFEDSSVVTNPYYPSEDQNAIDNLSKSSIYEAEELNYFVLAAQKATYNQKYMYSYSDRTLAYILNSAINGSIPSVNFGVSDATVKEVSITNIGDRGHAKIILSIPFQTESEMNVFEIDHVLFTVEFDFVANYMDGSLVLYTVDDKFEPQTKINDGNIIMTAIIEHQLNQALEGGMSTVATKTANAFIKVLSNLGKVGTATINSDKVVVDSEQIGTVGIKNGSISFITFVE